MVFFLRDKSNKTLVDVDVYKKDGYIELNSFIDIENYSNLLLDSKEEDRTNIITYFDFLSELRGWLWEKYFMVKKIQQMSMITLFLN